MSGNLTLPTLRPNRAVLTLAILLTILAGCGGTAQREGTGAQSVASSAATARVGEEALRLPESLYDAQFAAADAALRRFDWMSASVALDTIPGEPLTPDDSAYESYLQARIAYIRGNPEAAMQLLQGAEQFTPHPAIVYRLHNFRRHLLHISGDHLASAWLGTRMLYSAPPGDQAALKRAVWEDLQWLDGDTLAGARREAGDTEWQAWLELAAITRGHPGKLDSTLSQWLTGHRRHPASAPLPGGLEFLLPGHPPPQKVAMILPLSGKLAPAGKAVRDGFLASYFRARLTRPVPAEVLVLDSDNYGSVMDAYNDAVLQRAELVIGPLSKAAVAELAGAAHRPIPVIALNRIAQGTTTPGSAIVQLALAPEDEAARLAELAMGAGARRAMILRPAGAWGDKMERSLGQRWQQLGGSLTTTVVYTGREDYSGSIKSGLGLEASAQRKQRVRDMLASNVEFTPRRRQDVDAIFLLANSPAQARAIKPLLAFHYAGSLPVYAPSTVYGGVPDARDRDLDGINLVEIPWLLDSDPELRQALALGGNSYTRLNALGADAQLLQSRLPQLQAGPDALLRGATGILTLNPQLQIERDLPPATFDGGVLKPR